MTVRKGRRALPVTVIRALLEQISTRIREARTVRQWTQAQLAARVGIDPATLSRYESGLLVPDIEVLANICHVLNFNLAHLVDLGTIDAIKLMQTPSGRLDHTDEQAQLLDAWAQLPPRDRQTVIDICEILARRRTERKAWRTRRVKGAAGPRRRRRPRP